MKVILFGAEGQMGRTIKSLFEEDRKDVEILSIDRDSSAENLEPADIAMDFSSKDALSTVPVSYTHLTLPTKRIV